MRITTDDVEKIDYQINRNDPEAKILFDYMQKVNNLCKEYPENGGKYQKLLSNLKDETKNRLNISTNEQLKHNLEIITSLCEDDEREWREQKYGKQE